MKLILSRKGFDSGYGGVPSPIFTDGRMVSLPIPAARSARTYGEVLWDGAPLTDLTRHLTERVRASSLIHLDPDLSAHSLPRGDDWRPAFGQEKAAQRHLQNNGVGVGDLFLFFGWFREVEEVDGVLKYRRGAPDIHAIFGYLQVGEIIQVDDRIDEVRTLYPWLADHPHVNAHAAPGNTIYVAADRLTIDGAELSRPGGGAFTRYNPQLRLTAEGRTRTVWDLPGWFLPETGASLTYHRDAARWDRVGDRVHLKSVAKGQEFVMDAPPAASDWIRSLLGD